MNLASLRARCERKQAAGQCGMVITVDELLALIALTEELARAPDLAHRAVRAWLDNDRELIRNYLRQIEQLGKDRHAL